MPPGPIARTDTSLLGRWWWTVDRWTLSSVSLLVAIGILMSFSASPAVAERIGLHQFHFVKRHIIYLIPGFLAMVTISMMSMKALRRVSLLLFIGSLVGITLTLFFGSEIKGAQRWIAFAGMSIQPSEFLKPAFAILAAWMFAEKRLYPDFPGMLISFGLYAVSVALLIAQPDLGMVVLITIMWFSQFFLAGLSLIWVGVAGVGGVAGLGLAYLFLPHATKRIDQFLAGDAGNRFSDQYQITQSLESFTSGGFMGRGPGEGIIKRTLPDAHADFVFAVAGEEFGLFLCFFIAGLFLFIVLRNLSKVFKETNLFVVLAVSGLIIQFGIQALINMASTVSLIPTKGMTLPFISYGRSSMFSLFITLGMIMALTKERRHDS